MRIHRYEVLNISEIETVFNKQTNRPSYYFFDLVVMDKKEDAIKVVSRIAYTKKEVKKIKKLKYIHIIENSEEEVIINEEN